MVILIRAFRWVDSNVVAASLVLCDSLPNVFTITTLRSSPHHIDYWGLIRGSVRHQSLKNLVELETVVKLAIGIIQ
jgi:hypothetical protein